MKKLRIAGSLLATAALATTLASCSSSEPAASETASSETTETQAVEEPKEEEQTAESAYAVTLDSATLVSTYDGAPAVAITYTFTNNSEEATSPAASVYVKAFQNGVQLESAVVSGLDSGSYMSELKPGATATCTQAYALTDQSEVTVEAEELFSLSDELLASKVFTLA